MIQHTGDSVCVCVCVCARARALQVKRIKDPTCGLQSGDRVLMVDGEGLCVYVCMCVCARA